MPDLSAAFATFPTLETERCILRASTLEDAPNLLTILSDPQVIRYLGRPPMGSLDETVKRIEMFHTIFAEQTGILWVIAPRENPEKVIGTTTLFNVLHVHQRAELGYMLTPAYWGKGIVSEVVSAVLTCAFTTIGLHSVEASIDPENAASRRVLEKAGFVQEGYFHEDFYDQLKEKFVDTPVFSLLESTWMKRS